MKKRIPILLFAAVAIIYTALCVSFDGEEGKIGFSPDPFGLFSHGDLSVPGDFSGGELFAQLNPTEKTIYYRLYVSAGEGEYGCTVDGVDWDEYSSHTGRAVEAFVYDHPEFYTLDGGYHCEGKTVGIRRYKYILTLSEYTDIPENDAVSDEAERISTVALAYDDDYSKVCYVHDYLVNHIEYDTDAAKLNKESDSFGYANSAFGALVMHRATCAGYAKAFKLVLDRLGIPCIVVTGEATESHAWNCVKIDGGWYLIDLTWDDPDSAKDSVDGVLHNYFCITGERMAKDHTPDTSLFTFPECTDDKYDWFVYNGYEMDSYDVARFRETVGRQYAEKYISVRFTNKAAYDAAVANIIEGKGWQDIPVLGYGRSIRYSLDENLLIMTFIIG